MNMLHRIEASEPYPATWPSSQTAATDDGCPDLTGTYENRSFDVHPATTRDSWSLSEIFAEMLRAKEGDRSASIGQPRLPDDPSAVSIARKDGILLVRLLAADGASTELRWEPFFSRPKDASLFWKPERPTPGRFVGSYVCTRHGTGYRGDEPRLSLGPPIPGGGEASAWRIDEGKDTFVYLLRAFDGSLVLQRETQSREGLPIVLLVPSRTSHTSAWIRFRLHSSAP